jgi:two-component system, sensor histidine kinase and response regulator
MNHGRRPTLRNFRGRPSARRRIGAAIAFLFVFAASARAGTLIPDDEITNDFVHLRISDGLSQGSANAILQNRQGFIWIGTEDGLNRYDGYKFKIYRTSEDPKSLSNNWAKVLCEDSQGAIWVGTPNGLNRYDPATDDFIRFLNDPENPQSLSDNDIYAIYEDRAGTIWVGTGAGGLNAYDRKTGKFRRLGRDLKGGPSTAANAVHDIREDQAGLLWLATYGGLHAFNPKTGTVTRYVNDPKDPHSLSHNQVNAVFEDRQGTLWAGTNGGGLNALDRATGRFVRYLNAYGDPRSLSNNNVYTIYQDRAGNLYIGTNEGLNRFDYEKKDFSVIRNDPADPSSLSYDYVVSIYEDRSGVLWIGTRGRGIDKFIPDKTKFRLYQSLPNKPDSLVSNYIRAIAEDASGNLWIGTEDKGLDYLDRRSNRSTHFRYDPGRPDSLSSNFVYAIRLDAAGAVWLGTLGGGLNKYDPVKKTFSRFRHNPNDPGSLSHDSVRSLWIDRGGTVWVGTEGGGLNRFVPESGTFVHYRHVDGDPGSLSHDTVRTLFEDRSGTLWIGTFGGGLNRFDPRTGKFKVYRHDPADVKSICSDFIMFLNEDSEGRLWIGTQAGLDHFDPASGTFTCYTEHDGLPNNTIYAVLVDESDNVWTSSNRGLTRFSPGSRAVKTYDVSDGLQSNEFNGGAAFKTKAGEMFFGGTNGLNSFIPSRIKDNPFIPPIVITEFQILNKPVLPGQKIDGRVVLDRSITETTDLVLSYRHRLFSFEFAALHFVAPEKKRYAYRMDGFDKDWNDIKDRRFVSYTNLPAGRYTFRVKASNNDGVWNNEGLAVNIRIVPPFWKTWWFLGLALIAIGLTTTMAVRGRLEGIRARTALLERKVQERTAELQQQVVVRKKAEEEVVRRQKYLESVLFNSSNAIVATDAGGNIIEWSPGAEKMFAWTRNDVLGKNIDDVVIKPEFKDEAVQRSLMTLAGQRSAPAEAIRHRRDGTPLNVIVSSSPIVVGNDSVGGMAVYTDITELKRAMAAAEDANRAKSEFLANMSHEIRTPMNGIFGMTEMALETDLTPVQREYLEAVKTSADALMNVINDILDFSKIEANKIDIETIPFNLRDTVHAIVSGMSLMAEKKGLEIVYQIPPAAPNGVTGDPGRLRQILTNLLSNAIKFTNKGEVAVTVDVESRTDDRVRLRFGVRDTGIGIPPEKRQMIFEPFTQADSSTTRIYGGTGLGLAITKQLVELMGGTIGVESAPDGGSTFFFSIPLGLQTKTEEETAPARVNDLKNLPVLVVDDNAANRKILFDMLTHWGLKPTSAESAAHALGLLRNANTLGVPFKLIITDANMPEMDGFMLAAEIKKDANFGSPVIMMLSSSGFRGDSARCRKLGLTAYLTKPVKQSLLFDAILLALGTTSEKRGEAPLITRHSILQTRARFSILLAEDNVINQKLAVRILENRGHRVTVVGNGEEVLAALDQGSFDVVLMDVQMPNMDGFQATAEIRLRERTTGDHLPIVAMTAHAMAGDREKCLNAGMDDYVAKPLKALDLLKAIEHAVEKVGKNKRALPGQG